MKLELLPNEILLDLFEYFNGIDLLRAFYDLNARFNYLLYNQFQNYHFNFKSMSKRNFDMICQQHLPFIADRIISLSLTDDTDTPEQTNLFLSYIPSFHQFTQLRSLSLQYRRSYETLIKILNRCRCLSALIHLNVDMFFCQVKTADLQLIVNKIWRVPKLINCSFSNKTRGDMFFPKPTRISSSLECISINGFIALDIYKTNGLLEYTPHLKCFHASVSCCFNGNYMPSIPSTLVDLNLQMDDLDDAPEMEFLQTTPNLCRLTVDLRFSLIDGYQWEQAIRNYLPKLQVFRLQMKEEFYLSENIEERVDELIKSFQTPFWIDEHQWFVRCFIQKNTIYLSTLSKTFNYDMYEFPYSLKSTYPHDDYQEFYNAITSIHHETFFDKLIPSHIGLISINYLSIKFPINDQFWSIVPSLSRLKTLTALSHDDSFQSQVQALIDRAPNLYCLNIRQNAFLPLQVSLFQYTNASVRQLNLMDYNYYFTEEECIKLCQSPLGIQCEVLSIRINDCESIIYFIQNMINLRSLNVRCKDKGYYDASPLTKNDSDKFLGRKIGIDDNFGGWLRDRLPSTYLILNNPDSISDILIWI